MSEVSEQEQVNRWQELREHLAQEENYADFVAFVAESGIPSVEEALKLSEEVYDDIKELVSALRASEGITNEEADGILSILEPEWTGEGTVEGTTLNDKAALAQVYNILINMMFQNQFEAMMAGLTFEDDDDWDDDDLPTIEERDDESL